jgi:hypothetical protein
MLRDLSNAEAFATCELREIEKRCLLAAQVTWRAAVHSGARVSSAAVVRTSRAVGITISATRSRARCVRFSKNAAAESARRRACHG